MAAILSLRVPEPDLTRYLVSSRGEPIKADTIDVAYLHTSYVILRFLLRNIT